MVSMNIVVWLFCINQIICGIVGFIANSAVLVSIRRKRKESSFLSKTFASLSIANIISDICFIVSNLMFTYYFISQKISVEETRVLVVLQYANRFATCSSVFHIVFIAIQRFLAISITFQFERILSRKIAYIIIILIWIAALAPFSLFSWAFNTGKDLDIPFFYSTLLIGVILLLSYFWIWYLLVNRVRLQKQITNDNYNQANFDTSEHTLLSSCVVTVLFLATMLPFVTFAMFILPDSTQHALRILIGCLLVIKTLCDPLLYFYIKRCGSSQKSQKGIRTANTKESMIPMVTRLGISKKQFTV